MTIFSRFSRWLGAALGAVTLTFGSNLSAAGLLTPVDGGFPALEIRDHKVDVVIEDGYAITSVEQVFHNPHSRDLEAVYSFPVPEKAAVSELTLWIDGRPVTGEVVERQHARQLYENETAAGRDAGLTQQDSYKTFDTQVSPVRAGQDTRVRLTYIQPAHVDTGIGRYLYPLEEGGVDEQKLAFWTANESVTGEFRFDLKLRSAYPVDAVRLPNHPQAQISQIGPGEWQVTIASGQSSAEEEGAAQPGLQPDAGPMVRLDTDLAVYWRHQAGLPGSIDLVAYKPESAGRGTFMLVVTPGDDLKPITEGRDWVFVLDVSGSMNGKYATLADGVARALGKLNPEDRFHIVLFNSEPRELTKGFVAATAENVQRWSHEVASIQPGSGTNLYAGLKRGLMALDMDRTSGIVLVTDGVANVGETRQRRFIDLVKSKDVRLFTFVMGNSANRPMLDAMTKASGGFAMAISNSDDIVGQILAATSKVTHQALHGTELEISGIKTADQTPVQLDSLYRGQQLVLFGHYWGDGTADVRLTGRISGQPVAYNTRFDFPPVATDNPELERLWAYASIEDMMTEINDFGEKADLKQAVTDLGVEYGLVTEYTSLVVMREEQFEQYGIKRQNRDRLASELMAQQARAARPVQSRRVDVQQPMYNSNRASHSSGSGAFDPWALIMLLPLIWLASRRISKGADA